MKMLSVVLAGLIGTLGLAALNAVAADVAVKTVEDINKNQSSMLGQTVKAEGKVVKVNNGIMRRNFIHVRDGTGDANNNNLIVTSTQTAAVGDLVTVSGVVMLNRDFGGGYMYPLLIEDATVTPKK